MTRGYKTYVWLGPALACWLGCAQSVSNTSTTGTSSTGETGGTGATGATGGAGGGSGGSGGSGGTVPPMCVDASECVGLDSTCSKGDCVAGQCVKKAVNDFKPCDDSNLCTKNDQCSGGNCKGAPTSCGAASLCHIAMCNTATGECEEKPGDNGAPCDDGDPCTSSGTCQSGTCKKGPLMDCSLFDTDCTVGFCDPVVGCKSMPANDGFKCDDGLFCTVNEVCQNGMCGGGQATPCAPPGGCFVGMCDELNKTCSAVPGNDGMACDDGSPCTQGTLCSNGACIGGSPANEGMSCDDGTACTTGEMCQSGVCGGGTGPTVYFAEDFSDNSAGWVLGPEWQIGPAKMGFSMGFGPDPENDHTKTADDGIAGMIIGGDVSASAHEYEYIESPAFNTANAQGKIVLGYYRWLNCDGDPFMHSRVDVWNGNQWINVWASGQPSFDFDWVYVQHDITNYKNAAMRIRFGFDVKQMDFSTFSGWNLDDVLVASQACP